MAKQKKRHTLPNRLDLNRQRALARLDAILKEAEALANSGRGEAAAGLLEQNLARFANYPDLRAMLASLYGESGRYREAAEQARMAVDLAPSHAAFRLLAAMAYERAGYHSFAGRERRAWLQAGGSGELLPLMQELDAAFDLAMQALQAACGLPTRQAAEKAALLLDEGRWALDHARWPEALEHSRAAAKAAPAWPSPRNNVTVALIYLARYEEARREARAVLRDLDADNVHALANLVHLCVILGEPAEAAAAADRLAALAPSDPDELKKQVQGLAWLDRDADIDRILKAAQRKRIPIAPDAYVHWGVAAANQGRRREALQRLKVAEDAGTRSSLLIDTLDALEDKLPGPGIATRYPQTHFSDLLAVGAMDEAARLAVQEEKTGYKDWTAWDTLLARHPQLPMVLERMMYELPNVVEAAADLLTTMAGPWAKDILTRFVRGEAGSDEDRMAVLHLMQQAHMVVDDEPVSIRLNGAPEDVRARMYELVEDFGSDYPEEAITLYERAAAAQAKKQTAEAIRLYRLALEVQPKLKEAYNNLAVA